MQTKYGTYSFDANSTLLSASARTMFNRGGQPYSLLRSFTVSGYLSASGQAAITQAENALKTALAVPFRDLVLCHDDGSVSSEALLNAGSITGVKVTQGPTFSTTMGPEFATLRSFSFTAEAEYPLAGTANLLLDFQETLSFSGGGPLYAMRRAINGPPQRQLVYPATEYRCTQQGMAVGYAAYPAVPGPKFPAALREAPMVARKAPQRMGNGYQGHEVSWRYEHESAGPLVGVPSLWI